MGLKLWMEVGILGRDMERRGVGFLGREVKVRVGVTGNMYVILSHFPNHPLCISDTRLICPATQHELIPPLKYGTGVALNRAAYQ